MLAMVLTAPGTALRLEPRANEVLSRLRAGQITGAAVLQP